MWKRFGIIQAVFVFFTIIPLGVDAFVFSDSLSLGSRGEEVKALQQYLSQDKDMYPEGIVSGYYGSLTMKAVQRLQEKYDIPPVGRVGPRTRVKLNELASISNSFSTLENIESTASTGEQSENAVEKIQKQLADALVEIAKLKDDLKAAFRQIALSQKINSLGAVTITGGTVSGLSGLTDADIPDEITITGPHKKIRTTGTAPAVSSCGTSPSVTGSDAAGTITVGSGSVTSCTLTFNTAFNSAPSCVALPSSAGVRIGVLLISATAITFNSPEVLGDASIYYHCFEIQ